MVKPLRVIIPDTTKIAIEKNVVKVTGPKGELTQVIESSIIVEAVDGDMLIKAQSNDKRTRALLGLVRALLNNAIKGVNEGYVKTLELSGVGYRAQVNGSELTLSVGFSHPVKVSAPTGIVFAMVENKIKISGIDKHLVGQVAHTIRQIRPPEPYKGKGIKYEGEKIRRKAGKAAAKTAGGAAKT